VPSLPEKPEILWRVVIEGYEVAHSWTIKVSGVTCAETEDLLLAIRGRQDTGFVK
jgi:hypothetical protein